MEILETETLPQSVKSGTLEDPLARSEHSSRSRYGRSAFSSTNGAACVIVHCLTLRSALLRPCADEDRRHRQWRANPNARQFQAAEDKPACSVRASARCPGQSAGVA